MSYVLDMLPPAARLDCPAEYIPTRFLHQSLGKSKKPVTVVRWTPDGRRLLAGVHNGEFMLWNGMSFNFETVTAMGSSSLRTAEWSHNQLWLISANDEGMVFYLQPTLNLTHSFKAHDSPIRDLAWSPTDTKFVSASDDNTLKIWDFTTSTMISTFTDHGWDVKAVDWHPHKGLVVSGSKDHSVRLWDPRTSRNLTTLHGHKNAISTVSFSRLRPQLLATAGRDGQSRIFDLRMMRDVAILRGHEKGVTSLAWHPIHSSIVSTGGEDGALHTYLLTEPNTPAGVSTATVSPYNTPDPRSAPAQSIYPAHRVPFSHESSIWSLSWHPLGHILATGSNDHYVRFWSRSQPGDPQNCFKDKYHLGEEAAEAQGTYDRSKAGKEKREQEEQELEDEAEGLEDQRDNRNGSGGNGSSIIPGLPGLTGLPGLPGLGSNAPSIPGMNGSSTIGFGPPHPSMNMNININVPPPIDPSQFQRFLSSTSGSNNPGLLPPFPLPPPPGGPTNQSLPPPPLSLAYPFATPALPPGFPVPNNIPALPAFTDISATGSPLNMLPGLDPRQIASNGTGAGAGAGAGAGGPRTRVPLPSQSDGFRAEQARGNFRVAR